MKASLIDYTKFRLKPECEIKEIFKQVNRIFIFSCNKCYQRFIDESEQEYTQLIEILGPDCNKIVGHVPVDFLCNDFLSKKKILAMDLSSCDSVGVISCGLGIQFIAQLLDGKPVYALADSVPQSRNSTSGVGYHGISLEQEKCAGCDQCYLNFTSGICPITECAKSLLNGPCGGARNGKCEVDPSLDCAWIKIYERSKKRGERFTLEGVQIRDYSKPSFKLKNDLSLLNQTRRYEGFYGGLHPLDKKEETEDKRIEYFPEPEVAVIFLSQHTGKMARPLVKVGDEVKVGQKIGEADGFISSHIHSSISGKIVFVEERIHPASHRKALALIIKNNGKSEPDPSIEHCQDFEALSREALLEIITEKGVVGLGGAMFPTGVKLAPPKKVDTLIINGCECEPYLNCDNRIMVEHPEEVFVGISIAQKILGVEQVYIAVEDNKAEAITTLNNYPGKSSSVEIVSLKTKYPQGAEKVLINRILAREVPAGGLPFDVGVVVLNVATIFAIYQAVLAGLPLIQRVVTVSGDNCSRPGNYWIKIGTPFKNIVEHCFNENNGQFSQRYELKMGGSVMGIVQTDLESAIIKGSTGLIVVKKPPVKASEERECIKCGRCVEVCPMQLYPLYYGFYGKKGELERAVNHNVESCIECGCCETICSAKISLLSFIKMEKQYACSANKA
jgi:Na+-translocating ferredoxin:NAD+ oxidoreductase subunit C